MPSTAWLSMADGEKRLLDEEKEKEKAEGDSGGHVTEQKDLIQRALEEALIVTGSHLLDNEIAEGPGRERDVPTRGHQEEKEEERNDGAEGGRADKTQGGDQTVGRDVKTPMKEVGIPLPSLPPPPPIFLSLFLSFSFSPSFVLTISMCILLYT